MAARENANASTAIRHRRGQKAGKINGENKSVYQRRNGLTLARMSAVVLAIPMSEPKPVTVTSPGLRTHGMRRRAGFKCASTRRSPTPGVLGNGGTPPPIFLQTKRTIPFAIGCPGGYPLKISEVRMGTLGERGEGSAIPRKQPSGFLSLITMVSGDVDESHPI
jgi:hypothetical protein